MAKFCSNCGKKLEENAALCLNCGVLVGNNNKENINTKKKGLPTWAIILIIVGCISLLPIIFITIIAVTAFSIIKDTDFNIEEIIEENIEQRGTIGDTLITEDYKITLTNALTYNSVGEDEEKKDISVEGKEYLVFFFDIENISGEKQHISSNDFSGFVDGYTVPTKLLINNVEGIGKLDADLLPGTKTKGYISFEIDTNWQEFELYFDDSFETSEIVFTLVNEDESNITGA